MKKLIVSGLVLASLAIWSCTKEGDLTTYDCTGTTPTYTNDIKAIMDNSCAFSGCHDASSKRDGYDLSTYAATKSAAAKNAFLGSIEHVSGYKAMPDGGNKLDDATIKKISCWVSNGTPQ